MSLKKLSAWFLTDAGKKFSYFFAGSASTVFLIGNVLPHTLFLDKYKDIVHLYQNGFTVPLPEKLQKRFQKALELVEIDKKDQHLFKPFPVYGFDIDTFLTKERNPQNTNFTGKTLFDSRSG